MGSACSDTHKRSWCIPTIERFCSSVTEISDSRCSSAFYTLANQSGGRVTTDSNSARLEYNDHKEKLKTRHISKKMIIITGLDRTRQTVKVSHLKVTRRCASEQIRFWNEKDGVRVTFSDPDGTLCWSPTSTYSVRSDDVSHISSNISNRTSGNMLETSLISHAILSRPKGPKAKIYGAETSQLNQSENDSTVSLGYESSKTFPEILAQREYQSSPVSEDLPSKERDQIVRL